MTTRTYVTKSGDTYEWEETPEVLKAIEELHKIQTQQKETPKQ